MSAKEVDKESNEPDYDEDKDQLEEKQEEESGEKETTNQVFYTSPHSWNIHLRGNHRYRLK
jgi:hypothetical protein